MTEIIRHNGSDSMDVMTLGNVLARSGYFNDARDEAQAIVKVLAGQELGIGPIAAMMGIHIIKGRVGLSANLMASKIKGSGKYDYRVKTLNDSECTIEFYQSGQRIGESTFTAADAKRAGTQNMNAFPRNMLFARALSNGAKWYCPDAFNGAAVYTPDELRGQPVDGTGEIIEGVVETQQGNAQSALDGPLGERLKILRDGWRAIGGSPWRMKPSQLTTDEQVNEAIKETRAAFIAHIAGLYADHAGEPNMAELEALNDQQLLQLGTDLFNGPEVIESTPSDRYVESAL